MKYFVSVLLAMLVVDFAGAATPATGRGRASMSNQMMAAPRTVASKNQISAASTFAPDTAVQSKSSLKADDLNANIAIVPDEMVAGKKDMREKIREVMRFSGPRMIFPHPVMAIRHVIESKKEKKHMEVRL